MTGSCPHLLFIVVGQLKPLISGQYPCVFIPSPDSDSESLSNSFVSTNRAGAVARERSRLYRLQNHNILDTVKRGLARTTKEKSR